VVCGAGCCSTASGNSCCNGLCCLNNGVGCCDSAHPFCVNGVCSQCRSGQTPCIGFPTGCCDGPCCNDVCCSVGQSCVSGVCT
jgi:hypothetical protein